MARINPSEEETMKKLGIIVLVVLATAAIASAAGTSKAHQCVPEPISMLALAPGALMLLKRKKA